MLKVTLFIYILLLGIPVFSQEYLVKNYTPDPENTVSAIFSISQDRQGFIWLSSSKGVFRFDGKNFKLFSFPASVPSNLVRKIICDSKGILWFATNKDGIYSFFSGKFTKYNSTFKKITDIIEINGKVFAGSGTNLYAFDGKYYSLKKIIPFSSKSISSYPRGNNW
ncbi:MAG: two-component regulator propeller domain-containing protein, partial [Bacillota bacterium]